MRPSGAFLAVRIGRPTAASPLSRISSSPADSDNLYQWSQTITSARGLGTIDERPCLTINKTRQHNLQIINDAKQNKPSVKVKPVGNGATYDSALVFSAVCEHIEYISNAQQAYDTAATFQVDGGIGWWRVVTDYSGDDTFDQEIFIRRVKDPLTIYMDPDIREMDGSDAKFAFVFDDMTREEFNEAYPKYKDKATQSPLGVTGDWVGTDKVRIAEYYRVVEEKDKLVAFMLPTGERVIERKSKLVKELFKAIADDPQTKMRDIVDRKVEWYLIVGNEIAERNIWPGKYIPLVRVIGEETVIEGKLDRKGHTRSQKDPQRISNYWSSALSNRSPSRPRCRMWRRRRHRRAWRPIGRRRIPSTIRCCPTMGLTDMGRISRPLSAPRRPNMATAYIEGMKMSLGGMKRGHRPIQCRAWHGGEREIRGGHPAEPAPGRQRHLSLHRQPGDRHQVHRQNPDRSDPQDLRHGPRIIKIMGDDGVENQVTIDPKPRTPIARRAVSKTVIESIFNPAVGKYDVEAEVGPDNGTQRQEAFKALSQLMMSDKDLMKDWGDILVKMADFPMADVLAERLKRAVPPQLLGEGPPPALVEAQQHMQQMTREMQEMQELLRKQSEALTAARSQVLVHQEQKSIDVYKAVTDRLKILLPLITSPSDQAKMAHEIMMAEHGSDMAMLEATHSSILQLLAQQAQPQEGDEGDQPQQAAA
jgi:hypothetical protein